VDFVVSTHPDADHISGLTNVLEELEVGQLWMNRPSNHSIAIRNALIGGQASTLPTWLRESAQQADTVEEIANRRGVPIHEAFFDGQPKFSINGYEVVILGPSQIYYEQLVEEMREDQQQAATPKGGLLTAAYQLANHAAISLLESVDVETLTDDGETSPSNNSSIVLLIRTPDGDALLTADAGIPALDQVVTHTDEMGVDLSACHFQQVPHHGSKRNIGPSLLNTLIGPRGQNREKISVCVSAPKDGRPKHPSNKVTNAYKRRGADVFSTEGNNFWFHRGSVPKRSDYGPATPLQYDFTEEDE
jgi:beta-lactamase superfamily II metal-dependent hydrolase